MKRNIIQFMVITAMATAMLASCNKNKTEVNAPENGFRATVEGNPSNGNRTHLDGTSVLWNAEDQIKVRNGNGDVATYTLTAGENTTDGTFYNGENGDFFQPSYTAIYPAAEGNTVTGYGTATFTLPATQSYVANSFANGALPMMAVSDDQTLAFKNVLGGICFPMTGDGTVTRLVLTSNSDSDHLSGVFSADYNNGEPTLSCTTGGGNSITLDCGEGVTLNASTATDFTIMLPTGTLASGFVLQAFNGSTKLFEKSNTASLGADFISRSVIKKVNSNLVVAPAGAIAGVYSVSAEQQVWFSQGNLQYIGSAATPYWKFADNQWGYLGDNGQGSDSQTANRDLFGWGTSGYHNDADTYNTNYYPYSTSTSTVNTTYNSYGYGPSTNMTDPNLVGTSANYDWGIYNNIKAGETEIAAGTYRTLTNAEWGYLLNFRETGKTVNGTSNARYTEATINTDGSSVNGIILFPDGYSGPTSNTAGITFGTINSSIEWGTQCTSAGWQTLEAAGCVFLPAAGFRRGTSVNSVGSYGGYWSSTTSASSGAYSKYFGGAVRIYRYDGLSVRLVCPAE